MYVCMYVCMYRYIQNQRQPATKVALLNTRRSVRPGRGPLAGDLDDHIATTTPLTSAGMGQVRVYAYMLIYMCVIETDPHVW